MASLFHSIAAICACLRVPSAKKKPPSLTLVTDTRWREKKGEKGDAPETWTTCGMTLRPCPCPPPPPTPTLSSSTSAAQVVLAAAPRAARMMQRLVIGEKYLTIPPDDNNDREETKKNRQSHIMLDFWTFGGRRGI